MSSITRRSFLRTGLAGGATLAASTVSTVALAAKPASGLYNPGTYSAKAQGIGEVVVTMTFDANKITDVVLNCSGETAGIGQAAAPTLKAALMAAQSADIDAVSGASVTSSAVMKAAKKCIAQAKGEIPVEVITTGAAEEENGDWLGKAPEIAESSIKATHTTDILVIGCGTGGLFAVCAAAEEGGKVIGIDRYGTGTGIRDDLGAIDSRYQKKWGTKIDKLDFLTMMTKVSGGYINQDLVKVWADNSAEAIDWYGDRLAERGVELWHESGDKDDKVRYEHFATGHSPRWTGTKLNGDIILREYALKKGARFDFNTRMVKLEKTNGRVTGCIAENADGDYVRYVAKKGVVVATGGYARNYTMMTALQPQSYRLCGLNRSMPGANGDGIRACLWVGADMDETHASLLFDRVALKPSQKPGLETCKNEKTGFFWMGSQPWLKVNADGKRFMNESGTYENITHADTFQKGHCHFTLFDSAWPEQTKQFKMHGCSRLHPFENGADPNFMWTTIRDKYIPMLLEGGFLMKADTIEELARKLGLPEKTLKATVERYNMMAKNGKDEDYGKEPHRLCALDHPPFYGAKNAAQCLCTLNGIKINTNFNALDMDGNPIPGLFVIGNDSGGVFANTYPNLATGVACGRTVTNGRMLGKALAKAKA